MTGTSERINWLTEHGVCTRTNVSGEVANVPCPDCGHINTLHSGTDACIVCELRAELQDLRAARAAALGADAAPEH